MTIGEGRTIVQPVNYLFQSSQLLLYHSGSIKGLHHCRHWSNPPFNLTFHLSLTGEQDQETLELPCTTKLTHRLEGGGGADSHPSGSTVSCRPKCTMEFPAWWNQTWQHPLTDLNFPGITKHCLYYATDVSVSAEWVKVALFILINASSRT